MSDLIMNQNIVKLENEINSRHPKGIFVSVPLYEQLKRDGRITIEKCSVVECPHIILEYEVLDKKTFVYPADFVDGRMFLLPRNV